MLKISWCLEQFFDYSSEITARLVSLSSVITPLHVLTESCPAPTWNVVPSLFTNNFCYENRTRLTPAFLLLNIIIWGPLASGKKYAKTFFIASRKNILASLGITAAASAVDVWIQKELHGSGTTTLINSNEEMNDIMKIVQALEDSNILLKGATETIKNETKEHKGEFLSMLLGTLGVTLLGNLLWRKGIVRDGSGNKKGKGILRTGYGNKIEF